MVYKPCQNVLIDDSLVFEGDGTARTILFTFLITAMVTLTTYLASSIRERDGNTQGITRAIMFKFSVLFGIIVVHNTWAEIAFW